MINVKGSIGVLGVLSPVDQDVPAPTLSTHTIVLTNPGTFFALSSSLELKIVKDITVEQKYSLVFNVTDKVFSLA